MAKSRKLDELLSWYHREKPSFEALARSVESILLNLIKKAHIPIVSVTSRTKATESLVEKCRKKRYKNPAAEITDFVGLRVITYTEDDAARVCELVKQSFSIDAKQSIDKGQQLEVDQIGYRSYHFICDLGEKRHALPEFEAFRGKVFEVQVRTILQHAWAEVEHDRNYKFAGVLPSLLRRRLFLISGMLEVGDRELNQLSRDIDSYAAGIEERVRGGKLGDEELTTATLRAWVAKIHASFKKLKIHLKADADTLTTVVGECLAFGIKTTADLQALLSHEFLAAHEKADVRTNEAGFTRDVMMYTDLHRYFEVAWQQHWEGTSTDAFKLLSQKYGSDEVKKVFKQYKVEIHDFDFFDDIDLSEFDQ
jgi:putative GTP pyrophosphokinase